MKVLLTIEEYKERAANLVIETAKQIIADSAPDVYKWKVIDMLTEECFTWDINVIDQLNRMFFNTFWLDRNGNVFSEDVLSKIDQEEADEFNAQEWYVKDNEDAKKDWKPVIKIRPYKDMGRDFHGCKFWITDALLRPFHANCNVLYYIAKDIFKRMYGYEFEYDRDWKFDKE